MVKVISGPIEQWGVQLDDEGSMNFYDSEEEARSYANGCPVWKITYELQRDIEDDDG